MALPQHSGLPMEVEGLLAGAELPTVIRLGFKKGRAYQPVAVIRCEDAEAIPGVLQDLEERLDDVFSEDPAPLLSAIAGDQTSFTAPASVRWKGVQESGVRLQALASDPPSAPPPLDRPEMVRLSGDNPNDRYVNLAIETLQRTEGIARQAEADARLHLVELHRQLPELVSRLVSCAADVIEQQAESARSDNDSTVEVAKLEAWKEGIASLPGLLSKAKIKPKPKPKKKPGGSEAKSDDSSDDSEEEDDGLDLLTVLGQMPKLDRGALARWIGELDDLEGIAGLLETALKDGSLKISGPGLMVLAGQS